MHHITTADKTFLVGSDLAGLLMEYAALVSQINGGETVTFRAFGADGDEVVATVLLNSGTELTAETVHTSMPEPDNGELETRLRDELASYRDVHQSYNDLDETDGVA